MGCHDSREHSGETPQYNSILRLIVNYTKLSPVTCGETVTVTWVNYNEHTFHVSREQEAITSSLLCVVSTGDVSQRVIPTTCVLVSLSQVMSVSGSSPPLVSLCPFHRWCQSEGHPHHLCPCVPFTGDVSQRVIPTTCVLVSLSQVMSVRGSSPPLVSLCPFHRWCQSAGHPHHLCPCVPFTGDVSLRVIPTTCVLVSLSQWVLLE